MRELSSLNVSYEAFPSRVNHFISNAVSVFEDGYGGQNYTATEKQDKGAFAHRQGHQIFINSRFIYNFRHKNSVLCWLKRGRAERAAGIAVPVAHLIVPQNIITILTCGLFVYCEQMEVGGLK